MPLLPRSPPPPSSSSPLSTAFYFMFAILPGNGIANVTKSQAPYMLSATPPRRGLMYSRARLIDPSDCTTRPARIPCRPSRPGLKNLSIPEGRLIQTYSAHGYEVLSLAVAADNARFASVGGDRTVFLWDVATAQTTRRFGSSGSGQYGHSSRVNCVAFGGAEDSLVISGGFDTTVRVWDTKSGGSGGGKPVQVLSDARDAVTALAVRGPEIIAASVDGRVRSYDVRMGKVTTDVFAASVTGLSLARDGRSVLVATLDSKVRLMDRANGACLKTYQDDERRNVDLRVQAVLGGKEKVRCRGRRAHGAVRERKSGRGRGGTGVGVGSHVWGCGREALGPPGVPVPGRAAAARSLSAGMAKKKNVGTL